MRRCYQLQLPAGHDKLSISINNELLYFYKKSAAWFRVFKKKKPNCSIRTGAAGFRRCPFEHGFRFDESDLIFD
jgi:hypothetical protein